MDLPPLIQSFAGRLLVSCQAPEGDPFRNPESVGRFARSAEAGGAAAIRTNSTEDVRSVREAVALPIIGIKKRPQPDGKMLITASFEDARELVNAGADIVAVDCTSRGQRLGALERLQRIRTELRVPVMADIATIEEAVAAANAGADLVASTMRGYTEETRSVRVFEPGFISALAGRLTIPVIAEGRVEAPNQAVDAIRAGAYAVIVGNAITRPEAITKKFARAIEQECAKRGISRNIIGIDLGGTNTKAAVVSRDGRLRLEFSVPTPAGGGREVLLAHLENVARHALERARQSGIQPDAIGVATAGWVNPYTGRVAYATGNLAGWTGAAVADGLHAATQLPVAVENDANAVTVGERHFGAGRGVDDFVCLTLGTGIGGGCYMGGRLARGAHFFASALGHIPIQYDGLVCSCGRTGCLEVYTNAAALLRYAGASFRSAEEVIRSAQTAQSAACQALLKYTGYLATGLVSIIHMLDPTLVILSGGIAQENQFLFTQLNRQLSDMLIAPLRRQVEIRPSPLGYYGGVLGAAAVAIEKFGY